MNMQELDFRDSTELKEYFEEVEEPTDAIVDAIKEAIDTGSNSAKIYRVSVGGSSAIFEVTLSKKQWETALSQCLQTYQELDAIDKSIETWRILNSLKKT